MSLVREILPGSRHLRKESTSIMQTKTKVTGFLLTARRILVLRGNTFRHYKNISNRDIRIEKVLSKYEYTSDANIMDESDMIQIIRKIPKRNRVREIRITPWSIIIARPRTWRVYHKDSARSERILNAINNINTSINLWVSLSNQDVCISRKEC